MAHIGVLRVLEREGAPIHFLAGTSAGGLIAAAYAVGLSADEMEAEVLRMTHPRQLLTLVQRIRPWRGLLAMDKVREYLAQWLGDLTFDDLRVPLAVVAVDLTSGEKVVLREGPLLDAVQATIALPGLLSPVRRGDQLLVDGGLLDNLPADVVREMGADVVIAVDVSTDERGIAFFTEELHGRRFIPESVADTIDVLWRSVAVMMKEANRRNLEKAQPDLIIRPPIPPGVTVLTGLNRAAEVIAAGEQAAQEVSPQLRRLVQAK